MVETTHYKTDISEEWTAKDWYAFLKDSAIETMFERSNPIAQYLPRHLFIKDKEKRKALGTIWAKAYNDLIIPNIGNLPASMKPLLVRKVQERELRSMAAILIAVILLMVAAGGIIFLNYDQWHMAQFGSLSLLLAFAIAFVIIVILTQWYFVNKMIRDAIIRVCSKN